MERERRRAPVEPLRVSSNGKRFFSEAYKRGVVEECLRPGASVSAVALAHGFNANLVRKWIGKHQRRAALVPVTVIPAPVPRRRRPTPAPPVVPEGAIEIEVGGARVWVRGRVEATQLRLVLEVLGASR
jgi:transposase